MPIPRILIVDSDPVALNAICGALASTECELHFADRADRAMEALRSHPVDVVVSGPGMPDLPGSDFLRLVRRSFPGTKRIMLAGEGWLDAAIGAVTEGEIFRFLQKPWEDSELRAAIALAFEPRREPAPFPERVRALADGHARAKRNELRGLGLSTYHAERGDLVRTLLAAQPLREGQQPRRSLRVDCAFQASLRFRDETTRATTLNISTGGFALRLKRAPDVGSEAKVALRIPWGEAVYGDARVANLQQAADGSARVGYQFVAIEATAARRLELAIFDALIERLQG